MDAREEEIEIKHEPLEPDVEDEVGNFSMKLKIFKGQQAVVAQSTTFLLRNQKLLLETTQVITSICIVS